MIFLGLNGKDLDVTEADVVQVMVALAAGSLKEPQLAAWMRERLTRFSP
jgi:prophage maintenance system killer protein